MVRRVWTYWIACVIWQRLSATPAYVTRTSTPEMSVGPSPLKKLDEPLLILLQILSNCLLTSLALKSVLVTIITLVSLLIRQVVRHFSKSGLSASETETVGRIIVISFRLIVRIVGRLAGLYY